MTAKREVDVGERIFAHRDALGWSQSETARRSGVSRGTIVHAESGGRVPRQPTLRRLARAFSVSLEEFLSEADPRSRLRTTELIARLEELPPEDRATLFHGVWSQWTPDVAADAAAMERAIEFERETGATPDDIRRVLLALDHETARRLIAEGAAQDEAEAAYRRLMFEAVERGELRAAEAAEKSDAFNNAA